MKLFYLKPKNPDDPIFKRYHYDSQHAIVIRAETELAARILANKNAGDVVRAGKADAWLDPEFTTCEVLEHEGTPGVIIVDFVNG